MNRDLEKLLKEKWFLIVADLIVVIAILWAMPDKRDGGTTFIIVLAILLASLIVVIPVLTDGVSKAERLAEQARLRAALAEEINRLRDGLRAGTESANRRMVEIEMTAQKSAELVAQRASTEINALKVTVAELHQQLKEVTALAQSNGPVDELTTKVDELANMVRSLVVDVEEAAEAASMGREEAALACEAEIKSVRDDLKKSTKQADKQADRNEAATESLRGEVQELRASLTVASAPSYSSVVDDAPEAVAAEVAPAVQVELPAGDEAATAAEEAMEEVSEAEPTPARVERGSAAGSPGTSLIVNLMIGIGNKPFVRGTGPGLSKDKGVQMNFLGIGRWQWVCLDSEAPATVEIWKNDQTSMGEPLHLSGGEPVELDESHFSGS